MKTIFAELHYAIQKKWDTMLVTIVGDQGSAPRGTGSQMLVGMGGRLIGTIGGGAVEAKSVELAIDLLAKKESLLHRFLLRRNPGEDIGMICGGDVSVWFQYIPADDSIWQDLISKAGALFEQHEGGWFVQHLDGSAPSLIAADGSVLVGAAVPDETLVSAHTGMRSGMYFSMPLPLGERAIIFGAGHIALSLVPILKSVGFRPVVFDCRPEYAAAANFPDAEAVICGDYLHIQDYLTLKPEDYIVVMTNGHSHDFEVQAQILRNDFAYVGVIGSHTKTAAVNARLMAAGIPEDATRRVHTPIGTKIKAVTPQEIAVSIAGEMIYVRAVAREGAGDVHHHCPMHA